MGIETDTIWEELYLKHYRQAASGRLLGGFVHNINGPVQAFSMQTELFKWMFSQTFKLLDKMAAAPPGEDIRDQVLELRKLIDNRARQMGQLQKEISSCQKIMRSVACVEIPGETMGQPVTLDSIVEEEVFFLNADMFFKHKAEKELRLCGTTPALSRGVVELHQVVFILLENALEALRDTERRNVQLESEMDGACIRLRIRDSGCGIAAADLPRIFERFFTTKEGHAGLGLYLARRLVAGLGGDLTCESETGSTCFHLSVPVSQVT